MNYNVLIGSDCVTMATTEDFIEPLKTNGKTKFI